MDFVLSAFEVLAKQCQTIRNKLVRAVIGGDSSTFAPRSDNREDDYATVDEVIDVVIGVYHHRSSKRISVIDDNYTGYDTSPSAPPEDKHIYMDVNDVSFRTPRPVFIEDGNSGYDASSSASPEDRHTDMACVEDYMNSSSTVFIEDGNSGYDASSSASPEDGHTDMDVNDISFHSSKRVVVDDTNYTGYDTPADASSGCEHTDMVCVEDVMNSSSTLFIEDGNSGYDASSSASPENGHTDMDVNDLSFHSSKRVVVDDTNYTGYDTPADASSGEHTDMVCVEDVMNSSSTSTWLSCHHRDVKELGQIESLPNDRSLSPSLLRLWPPDRCTEKYSDEKLRAGCFVYLTKMSAKDFEDVRVLQDSTDDEEGALDRPSYDNNRIEQDTIDKPDKHKRSRKAVARLGNRRAKSVSKEIAMRRKLRNRRPEKAFFEKFFTNFEDQ